MSRDANAEVTAAPRASFRMLRPAAPLLLAFHVGQECVHSEKFLRHPVSIDFQFLKPDAVARQLTDAGFALDATIVRNCTSPWSIRASGRICSRTGPHLAAALDCHRAHGVGA